MAPLAARLAAARTLQAGLSHYVHVYDVGKAILGTTQYADATAGLAAIGDPSSAAARFSAWRQSSRIEQDVTSYLTAFGRADANFNADNEPASIGPWRDDMGTLQADIAAWVNTSVSWQIQAASNADLAAAEVLIAKDVATVQADMKAVQAGQ